MTIGNAGMLSSMCFHPFFNQQGVFSVDFNVRSYLASPSCVKDMAPGLGLQLFRFGFDHLVGDFGPRDLEEGIPVGIFVLSGVWTVHCLPEISPEELVLPDLAFNVEPRVMKDTWKLIDY